MAIIRMREVIFLARDGQTWTGPEGYTWQLTLADLYARTQPTDWEPQLPALADWVAGQYEITREAAARVTAELNDTQPWEPPAQA